MLSIKVWESTFKVPALILETTQDVAWTTGIMPSGLPITETDVNLSFFCRVSYSKQYEKLAQQKFKLHRILVISYMVKYREEKEITT